VKSTDFDQRSCYCHEYINKAHLEFILHYLGRKRKEYLLEGPIVDLGCGNGDLLHKLKESHPLAKVIGIDREPYEQHPDVQYLKRNFTGTGLSDKSVLIVVSSHILDYSREFLTDGFQFDDLFREVNRILVPGGLYFPFEFGKERLITPFRKAGYHTFGTGYQEKPFTSITLS